MMNNFRRSAVKAAVLGTAVCLALGSWSAAVLAQAPAAGPAAGQPPPARGGGGFNADPRAQTRTYHFADANADMQYCVFASSKVSKDKPAPLIVSLHGLGAPPTIMCNTTAVDLAEEGGYILVAPMGYSVSGWYGSPVMNMGAGGRRGPGPGPGSGPAAGGAGPGTAPVVPAPGTGPGAASGAGPAAPAGPSPEQIAKWSEQDVLNVLDLMRKEFNVDSKRIYLTGHSMGGAGTYFLGSKHADIWAAIAPVAPASFLMNQNRAEILKGIKDAGLPMLIITGDADEAVPVTNTRTWVETAKELDMDFEYIEQPGVTHGPIITSSQKDIYAFFDKHSKK